MTIDAYTAQSLAVSYGTEDYFGPWELLWGLNTYFPVEPRDAKEQAGLAALIELLRAGLLELHVTLTQFPNNAPVSAEQAIDLLSSSKFWKVPAEAPEPPFFWFVTTSEGEAALEAGRFASL